MIAVHFSSHVLKPGDVIRSSQDRAIRYRATWDVYARVAAERGAYWPATFGYAYPANVHRRGRRYEVSAPDEFVTRGNYNHSLYLTLDELTLRPDKRRIYTDPGYAYEALKDRINAYFDAQADVELISDRWVVERFT